MVCSHAIQGRSASLSGRWRFSLPLFVVVLFFGVTAAFAQQSTNSRIDRLRGGIIGMKFKWSGEAFSGLGSRADAMGGSISTLYPGPASISSNPSGLGFARGFSVTLDWSPPLTIDPGGILGVEGEINNTLMETAQNNSPGGVVRPGTVEDAVVNSELAMHGGLKGGAIMYGTRALTVAASFHQPFQLETQMNMSGIEFLATALDDQGKETNRIFGTVNGNLNVKLTVEASSLGVGTRVLPNLAVGMTYENFNGEMNFESTFLPEGIISSSGGDTRFFNDPARIQYDSLYAITRGDWEGNGARLRWGVGYHPNSKISLDAVVNLPFTIDLKGPFSMVYNKIRALNLGAGEDEEVFDVDILVEDNLTKTEKRTVKVPGMDIEVPGSFSVGFSAGWSNYVTSAVYTRYFDHLAYRLAYQQFDSLDIFIEGGDIHQGVDFKNAFRLGIGVEQLILGLGVVFGETFRVENKDLDPTPDIADRKTFFLPFFSLGGGVNLSPSLRLDYIFSPYNSSFIRFSTTYRM